LTRKRRDVTLFGTEEEPEEEGWPCFCQGIGDASGSFSYVGWWTGGRKVGTGFPLCEGEAGPGPGK